MSDEDKKGFKLVLADSFFESLDAMGLSDEEKQKLIDDLQGSIIDGSFFEEARPITDEEREELERAGLLNTQDKGGNRTIH